jgi:intergrase/recombinase
LCDHSTIKLEFNKKRNSRKYSNTWRLSDTLLPDQRVIREIMEEIKKSLEFNENESTTYQNLWDTAKAVLRKFIAINAYIKTEKDLKLMS